MGKLEGKVAVITVDRAAWRSSTVRATPILPRSRSSPARFTRWIDLGLRRWSRDCRRVLRRRTLQVQRQREMSPRRLGSLRPISGLPPQRPAAAIGASAGQRRLAALGVGLAVRGGGSPSGEPLSPSRPWRDASCSSSAPLRSARSWASSSWYACPSPCACTVRRATRSPPGRSPSPYTLARRRRRRD